MVAPWDIVELGVMPFRDAWARQLELVELRKAGAIVDTLMIVEHPHVFTLGRSRAAEANVLAPGDVEVVAVERGGDVTYHGPGQLVAYPIVQLADGERDLHKFLRHLEDAMIRTCARFEIVADREPGKTGVWTDAAASPASPDGARQKLASIGIACRKWVTFHGLALNVATDLTYFDRINPCGFASSVMTSMTARAGHPIAVADVTPVLIAELGAALGRAPLTARCD